MAALKIIADENIPAVADAFGRFGEVLTMPGWAITPEAVRPADALLVRSVTPVTHELVAGSAVKFVGSATIGTDHVDQDALTATGVVFAHAPGSNAESVVGYVIAALAAAAHASGEPLEGRVAGIVGCGNVGSRLIPRLRSLGMRVLPCDPPLAERTGSSRFVDFDEILSESDIISLHVPLAAQGDHPTYHMLNAESLRMCRPGCWIVNTSRGAVVNNAALREAVTNGTAGLTVLDVWEGEPNPDVELIARAFLATPHIAGYSTDGKLNGTRMLFDAFCRAFGADDSWPLTEQQAAEPLDVPPPDRFASETEWLDATLRLAYDIRKDDRRMRAMAELPEESRGQYFHELRRTHAPRRDFDKYEVQAEGLEPRHAELLLGGLGFRTASAGGHQLCRKSL